MAEIREARPDDAAALLVCVTELFEEDLATLARAGRNVSPRG